MKYLLLAGALVFSTAASAQDELVEYCKAALEAQGGNPEGCSCLMENMNENPTLFEELMVIGADGDLEKIYDSASDELIAVLDECKVMGDDE
ncbi:MAG: hypothetical protein AAF720_05760 [Pseudomonadota bacterium]